MGSQASDPIPDRLLVVDVLGLDFQLFFAGLANPVVFAIDEGVVMDTETIVFGAEITLHEQ
jgi:hypothetical protein